MPLADVQLAPESGVHVTVDHTVAGHERMLGCVVVEYETTEHGAECADAVAGYEHGPAPTAAGDVVVEHDSVEHDFVGSTVAAHDSVDPIAVGHGTVVNAEHGVVANVGVECAIAVYESAGLRLAFAVDVGADAAADVRDG